MMRLVVALVVTFAGGPLWADRITWFSNSPAINHTSAGVPMDGSFRFELGVFAGSFVPLSTNQELWAQNWRPAMRLAYDAANSRFLGTHEFDDNGAPFTAGKLGYIWGFRGGVPVGEWILFRAASWTWPVANPLNPQPPFWKASDATEIVGDIEPSGSPYLMKSAAVANVAPPSTTWEQWRDDYLANEPLDAPGDDPDRDGISNLLEFVFDSDPKLPGPRAVMPLTLSGERVQISIPRRIDHPASLVVEVSGDLISWHSGPLHTEVVSDGSAAMVVRDLTPLGQLNPKRFIRLKAALGSP